MCIPHLLKIFHLSFSEVTAPSHPLFDSLQILKLNDLFQLQVASFVYECINSLAPIYFKNYCTGIHTVHGIRTCQARKGHFYDALRCITMQYGIRSIHYSSVRLWNSLPIDIKESNSLQNFKKKLKSHFYQATNIELLFIPFFYRLLVLTICTKFFGSC